jgi:hypothetical protein
MNNMIDDMLSIRTPISNLKGVLREARSNQVKCHDSTHAGSKWLNIDKKIREAAIKDKKIAPKLTQSPMRGSLFPTKTCTK